MISAGAGAAQNHRILGPTRSSCKVMATCARGSASTTRC